MPIPIADIQSNEIGSSVRSKLNDALDYVNLLPLKLYRAKMSQSGSSDPTAVIMANSFGSIVWTRSSTGLYLGTLASAFPLATTLVFGRTDLADEGSNTIIGVHATRASDNTIALRSTLWDLGAGTVDLIDDAITNYYLEIAGYA